MLNLIYGIIIGVIVSSVAWFFVWKNNKLKFAKALESVANLEEKLEIAAKAVTEVTAKK